MLSAVFDVVPALIILAIYSTTHLEPLGIVTDIPLATVTGPVDDAL